MIIKYFTKWWRSSQAVATELVLFIKVWFTVQFSSCQAFAIFCGLGIHNTMIYDQMAKAKAKQQVAIEVGDNISWLTRSLTVDEN